MFKNENKSRPLPSLKGVKPQSERTASLPFGMFLVSLESARTVDSNKHLAIVVEFTVEKIAYQEPTTTKDSNGKEITNAAKEGDRRMHWFDMQDEFGYGLAEFYGLMTAIGVPEEKMDEARNAALGTDNPLRGQRVVIKRTPSIAKRSGNIYAKTFFQAE
jgi:hypothetical protein